MVVDLTGSIHPKRHNWLAYRGKRWTKGINQLRLMERIVRPKGKYGEETVEQIRVLEPNSFMLFQRNDDGDFVKVDEGTTSLDFIPLVLPIATKLVFMKSSTT